MDVTRVCSKGLCLELVLLDLALSKLLSGNMSVSILLIALALDGSDFAVNTTLSVYLADSGSSSVGTSQAPQIRPPRPPHFLPYAWSPNWVVLPPSSSSIPPPLMSPPSLSCPHGDLLSLI
ncbi:hypothetical protein LX36DRAFT_229979 [Colletotrichum falcatum]|nr:hypothetical protein LX36DRAFT_229979 [Colletotrichum falcatum]